VQPRVKCAILRLMIERWNSRRRLTAWIGWRGSPASRCGPGFAVALAAGIARSAVAVSGGVLSGALLLSGCATQHGTAQALTIAGAAAVIVGASIASDSECYEDPEGGGGYCSPSLSRGTRRAGTALAVAGAGAAAVGYALQPKGPDRLQRAPANLPAPAAPYRLIRPVSPEPEVPPEPNAATPEAASCLPSPEGSTPDAPGGPCGPASEASVPEPSSAALK
jgi:hypothetical protein